MNRARARLLARVTWPTLILWQFAWLALLPAPLGKEKLALAALFTVPLLLPLPGILRGRDRSLIWGGYLGLFAAMFGMMELWTVAAERPAAGLQLFLCCAYLFFLALATRKRRDLDGGADRG